MSTSQIKQSKKIYIGGIYKHFKGKEYIVFGVATHTETQEEFVVYQRHHNNQRLWIRPLEMFLEKVERNGKKIPRFKYDKEQTKKLGKQGYLSDAKIIRITQKFIERYRPAFEALAKK